MAVIPISVPVTGVSISTLATASPSIISILVVISIIITVPPSWTAASGTTPGPWNWLHYSPFINPFSIWTVLGKLHHDLPPVYQSPIEPINCLLCLVLVLVPHERESARVASPAVPWDVDVDNLAVLVEEREEVISSRAEGDVEDEE